MTVFLAILWERNFLDKSLPYDQLSLARSRFSEEKNFSRKVTRKGKKEREKEEKGKKKEGGRNWNEEGEERNKGRESASRARNIGRNSGQT
jgi:hypothetical protein